MNFFNRIIIENKGDKVSYSLEHISDFLKSEDQILDFNRVKKSPEHQDGVFWNDTYFTDEDKKIYGNRNIFDWSIEYWGTRLNCFNVNMFQLGNKLIYTFNTKDRPATKIAKIISAYFFGYNINIDFYDEENFGYNCGTIIFKSNQTLNTYVYIADKKNKAESYGFLYDKKIFKNSYDYLEKVWGKQLLIDNNMYFEPNIGWNFSY
jgi:hypothetical protein